MRRVLPMTEMKLFKLVLEDSIHPDLDTDGLPHAYDEWHAGSREDSARQAGDKDNHRHCRRLGKARCDFCGTFLHTEAFLHIGTRQENRRGIRTAIVSRPRTSEAICHDHVSKFHMEESSSHHLIYELRDISRLVLFLSPIDYTQVF